MKHLLSFRKHRSWKTLVIGFFLFNSSLFAQNLVVNPSFEDVNIGSLQCSWYTTVAQFNNAINNWTLPTGGSTDIFNTALATTCYSSPFSTNGSSPGTQAPRTGNGYCNIVTYGNGGCDPWREYLQGELTSALVVGQTYEVEMWVTLADKMSVGTNNIGVKFSTNTYTQGGNCGYYTTPDLNYTGPIILDKQNWVQILFCYTPTTAGLDNFIIGNFYNDAATTTAAASGVTTANTIRYFVEDVRIELAVGGPGDAGTNGAIALCNGDLATDLFNSLGGIPDMTGTWSGPSVLAGGYLGTFDPGINVAGTYTYTVNGGAGLCAAGGGLATAEVVVTINPDQDATIIPVGPFCPTDPAIVMLGVNPGGTWSGTGITNPATGAFDPAVAGPGTWTITYTLANPCGDVQTFDVVVNNLFDATITPVGPFCPTDAAIVMIGVDPGGTWSGTGITNPATGAFDPAAAGPGTWTITYTIGGACGDVQTYDVVINPNQDATIIPVGPFCPTDPAIVMLGVNPGGTWSGTGITNPATGAFDPAVAGPGTWTITYTLANPCGDVQTFDVVVNNLFDATITPVGPFCPTDAAIVMIGVDPGGTWSGTGITNPATGAFDPAAAGPGTWTITYTIGGACGDVQTYDVVINPNQDATITPVGPFCPTDPAIVMLGVNPGGTWSGTGITNPATGAFDPAVAGPGTWTITYTLANPCGDVQTFDVVVNNLFDATITPVGPFCPTDAAIVMIGVDPGGTWSGTGITNPATGAFDPAAAGPGTWTITYTIGGACGDVQTYDVVINPNQDATITPVGPFCPTDPAIVMLGVNPGGTWSGTGITNPATGAFDPAVAGPGTWTITYTLANPCGDVQTFDVVVNNLFDATITPVGPFCPTDAAIVMIGVDPGGTWSGTGITNPATGAFDPAAAGPGTWTITYTIGGACGDVQTYDVVINPIPVIDFSVNNIVGCAPLDVFFTNNSVPQGTNCLWDFGDGSSSTICGAAAHQFNDVGCYNITLTVSEGGCSNSLTQTSMVCVVEDPIANFTISTEFVDVLDPEIHFTNTSSSATSYIWDFGDGAGSSEVNPTHQYGYTPGEYIVCLTAMIDFGCLDEICKPVLVQEGLTFYLPNSFTPDGDQHNQMFKPVFTSGFDPYDFSLLIFDRWGEVIWESNDTSVGWDGIYNGKLVQSGTYVWKVEFKTLSTDERIVNTGHVNVIR